MTMVRTFRYSSIQIKRACPVQTMYVELSRVCWVIEIQLSTRQYSFSEETISKDRRRVFFRFKRKFAPTVDQLPKKNVCDSCLLRLSPLNHCFPHVFNPLHTSEYPGGSRRTNPFTHQLNNTVLAQHLRFMLWFLMFLQSWKANMIPAILLPSLILHGIVQA